MNNLGWEALTPTVGMNNKRLAKKILKTNERMGNFLPRTAWLLGYDPLKLDLGKAY